DPAKWRQPRSAERDLIVLNGVPKNPASFPRDSCGRAFPVNIFFKTLPNGEKVSRDWLVWSQSAQGLFCFPCCLFDRCSSEQEQQVSMLGKSDARLKDNWKKLYDLVTSHEHNPVHLSLYFDWKNLEKSLKKHIGIDAALQKQIEAETVKWREILKCSLYVTLFLAERNLSLCGSNSKIGDRRNGLFLGTLELLSRHNRVLELHLQEAKKHQDQETHMQVHYFSWRSQNEFIEECGKLVLNSIIQEVQKAFYYSIIVDGTPDASHTEQITFVLRYAYQNQEIKEHFLTFEDCEKKKGQDIAELICRVLEENGIDLQNCGGQGYDNGSNMAGIYKRAQAVILQKNPQAIYSLCSVHSLNLCGVHAAESSTEVKSFFGNIQKLYNLFSSSPARWKILQKAANILLHSMLQTWWSARIEAVKPLAKKPREILQVLVKLKEELDLPVDLCNEVDSLSKWFKSFEFVLLATLWFKTLQTINDVSHLLQDSEFTLDEESRLMKSLLKSWPLILDKSKLVAAGLGHEQDFKKKRGRKRKTFHDEDKTTANNHENQETEFKVDIFYDALDMLIHEITRRSETAEKINSMFSFIWNPTTNDANSSITKAQELSKCYPRDLIEEEFVEETRLLNKQRETLFGKVTSIKLLNKIYEKGLQSVFPQTCVVLRIFVSILISVSEGECSFSKLALIKNCLQSTMGQDRISALVMLSTEHDIARSLNYDSVINAFASKNNKSILKFSIV
uniref:DUF4371 domain-containing protein n=1 Tax=Latimeria chalumnae TaxID=7897 RepID=H2ZW52_LATCH